MNFQADEGRAPRLPAHEIVYRALRDRVLYGDLAPGQPVTIQGLVEEMGAGMTPVREALRRLTAEGALEFQGNRRISVPFLGLEALDELLVARRALEPELAYRACLRITPRAVAELEKIDATLDRAILRGDTAGYLVHNHAFHARLNAEAEAPILSGMIEGLWLRFGPSLRVVCGQFGTRGLPDLHKAILSALKNGDAEGAREAMAGDLEQGMALIRRALAAPPDSIDMG